MKVASFSTGGAARPGLVIGDRVVELAAAAAAQGRDGFSFPGVLDIIDAGPETWERLEAFAVELANASFGGGEGQWWWPAADVHFAIPYMPRKDMIAVGANYWDHLVIGYGRINKEPVAPPYPELFTKRLTAVIGDGDTIVLDKRSTRCLDSEVELAVVLGRPGRDIPVDDARSYIFGYTVSNDISGREFNILHTPQWSRGKSLDTFCPFGPVIVTPREIDDVGALRMKVRVNGFQHQDCPVGDMLFDVDVLIASLSEGLTIEPGDVIMCGSGSGVGFEAMPQRWLMHDDVLETEITGIGVIRNTIKQAGV
jgi:2-keto-4-pentenoate hydratase/2-oxohepta-3-ene-1,7-dioic acid hydratase in catechol pathway